MELLNPSNAMVMADPLAEGRLAFNECQTRRRSMGGVRRGEGGGGTSPYDLEIIAIEYHHKRNYMIQALRRAHDPLTRAIIYAKAGNRGILSGCMYWLKLEGVELTGEVWEEIMRRIDG